MSKAFRVSIASRNIIFLSSLHVEVNTSRNYQNINKYTSREFVNFCKDVGIKRELTIPYNPQQNGVAEINNITIMEAVKTMIHDQDLPMNLWAKPTRTTIYVHNRLSHNALGFKTPKEMFSRKKP
jgi:transposase InsO family protein